MKKFYLQVNSDNIITDAIEYPHGDYVEIEVEGLPIGVNSGWFKLEDGKIVEYPELKPITQKGELMQVKERLALAEQAINDILMGGLS